MMPLDTGFVLYIYPINNFPYDNIFIDIFSNVLKIF